MSKTSSLKSVRVWDCTESCRSEYHARRLNAAITKRNLSDFQIACYLVKTCRNFSKISDGLGKTVLHTAASCGRKNLCQWLITKAEANASVPDLESGYTPLHTALFYGYVDVAVKLIELGAKPGVLDREHLSPISLLSLDTSTVSGLSNSCTEVYVCGSNLNYTLGVGTNDPKKTPEVLEFFRRNALSIKEICMEEFHTVFVTTCHQVYVCGHGQGGRLGIGKEKPLLIPTQLPTRGESCIHAAVGLNHTLLLLSNGGVLSCGSNLHHQLGISPYAEHSSTPRYVNINATRPFGVISAICASRYHSVFCTSKAIFACGLNAGQLGCRDNRMDFFTVPQQLAVVGRETDLITHVTTSLGSVSYATSSGDIFTFHQFQCKKIMRCPDIVKLESQGGHLASVVNGIEGGEDLKITWLTKRGTVFIWQEKRGISKCSIGTGRILSICDICLRNDTLLMVTKYGEAFSGLMKTRETGVILEKVTKNSEIPCWCSVNIKQFSNMHRALSITSDPKGKNIAVIQAHPSNPVGFRRANTRTSSIASHMKSFLEQASEYDNLHDITFSINNTKVAAHKFIMASRGCPWSLLQKSSVQVPSGIPLVIFEELLKFVYTGDSALLHLGKCREPFLEIADPVKKLAEAATFAGVEELQKRLQSLRFENGVIYCFKELKGLPSSPPMCFDRQLLPALCDVDVVCDDSVILKAHKCILAARMEYFNNMFMRGWTEAEMGMKIHLQCSSRIVNWILDFLYTDRLPESLGCEDLDNIIKLLIASDQYLIDDLKDECAIYLSELLSLKNCVMILQLANTYNEQGLKVSVMEYIAYNLNAVIENRYLEFLDDALLSELNDYCRESLAVKFKDRAICTYFDAPSDEEIVEAALEMSFTDSPMEFPVIADEENDRQKLGSSGKKKTPKKIFAASPPGPVFSPSESDRIRMSVSVESAFSPSSSSFESSFNNYEFPLLSESFSAKAELAKSPPKQSVEPRRVYPPKLSQKQRKKLASEFEEKLDLNQDEVKPKRGWAKIELPPETPLELSRSPITEPAKKIQEAGPNLVEIIAKEQQKRTNLRKMTTKPFHLTQMEDSAMLDLEEFYNVGCSYEERITITRVVPLNVAEPTWMPLSRRLPVL
uniref:Inhibitor of Bruton tyrosine kinase n=1 Tax=Lygus hesperus TaxID=30085 RepID=A0A146MBK5_LYGHE